MKWLYKILMAVMPVFLISCGESEMPSSYTLSRIYSISTDGSNLTYITTGKEFTILQDDKIIYLNDSRLYKCNAEGNDVITISPEDFEVHSYLLYMNDTKILLSRYAYTDVPTYTINSDGSNLTQLQFPEAAIIHGEITMAPDGSKFVYTNFTGMYLMDFNGTTPVQIRDTVNSSSFFNLSFTPDGKNIIYIDDIQLGVALDLRSYELLSHKDTTLFYDADGNKVRAYTVSDRNSLLFSASKGIYLEDLPSCTNTFLHSGGDPHFSRDTTKITFMNYDDDSIFIMDITQQSTNEIVVNLPGNFISRPVLSSDGTRVYFQADSSWEVLHKLGSGNGIVNSF